MGDSPAVILYDSTGKAMEVKNGVAIPADTQGYLVHGRDSSGNARVAEFIDDSGVNRLQTSMKPATGHGLALESKQDSILTELGQKTEPNDLQKSVLHDPSGNAVSVALDGTKFRVLANSKVARASDGSYINPATEETVEASRALLQTIDGDTSHIDVDLSTRATEATLASIKDTDGIKKITDQLPAGTNEIGKVAQGTKAAGSAAWPQVLYDASGNAVGVVLDGTAYRLQSDAKIAKGASDLVHLDVVDTDSGKGRLKATLYSPEGEAIALGTAPPDPASIKNEFIKNGSNTSLLVDGSVTPVVFSYDASPTYDISIQEIKFTLVSNSVAFGTGYFGATAGPLPNGILVEIVAGGSTGTLCVMNQNECFVNFASPGGFQWIVSSKDLVSSAYVIGGGLKLQANTSDKVRVTIRDDIDSCGVYFRCMVKGNLLSTGL